MQIKSIDPVSLKKRLDEGNTVLIDVREAHEHAREHIEGARLVPLSRFQVEDFSGLRDKTAVFHCQSGGRTGSNARLLTSKGFRDAYHLAGASRPGRPPVSRPGRNAPSPAKTTANVSGYSKQAYMQRPWVCLGAKMRWPCCQAARSGFLWD